MTRLSAAGSLLVVALCALASGTQATRQLFQSGQQVQWYEPSNGRLNGVSVPVGGSLTFVWTGTHDLWEVSSLACPATFANATGIQQLAPQSRGGSYTVRFAAAGVRYFACSVGDHCEDGQLIAVSVGGAPAPSPSGRYRGGSSSNYGADGQPTSNYGGSNYGEDEEEEEEEMSGGSSYGSNYGSGR